ncbi:MAG TPA: hypothetical protein VHK01_12800 [Lacipirellulaceae bacterium]|nr:hypothetical protein [Lacipirellulaceae bacterium]
MYKDSHGRDVPFTPEEFLRLLIRSELATKEESAALLAEFREVYLKSTWLPDSITAFCSYLVGAGHLTTWQCAKLRQGQWKGFYLGGFELLDLVSIDEEKFSHYLARNTGDDAIVRLAITPPARANGHDIEYRVVERF